jgi:hypothetical protein
MIKSANKKAGAKVEPKTERCIKCEASAADCRRYGVDLGNCGDCDASICGNCSDQTATSRCPACAKENT